MKMQFEVLNVHDGITIYNDGIMMVDVLDLPTLGVGHASPRRLWSLRATISNLNTVNPLDPRWGVEWDSTDILGHLGTSWGMGDSQ